ncbi:alpha-galactosidase [Ligilactobacillus sp. WC1T17]|uniref:Alpha-galactosidase n=1 Tax=Ligilactobacillus ruminis TaxID=1623 RepID=A0ABY1AAG4_9LACO|nr:alpha-galactosidase [Ligilactobacillus ruminis]
MTAKITFDNDQKVFHLTNGSISYLFSVEEGETLSHLYFGKAVKAYHGQLKYPRVDRGFSGNLPGSLDRTYSKDTLPREYSSAGEMDYHEPATIVRQKDGSNALNLKFDSYEVKDGKPALKDLPASYTEDDSEAQTLSVNLKDEKSGLIYTLLYTIFSDFDIIARSVLVKNGGQEAVYLEKVASAQVDFVDRDFDVICLPGAHANERHMQRTPVTFGSQAFESRRGSSSHQMNPFIALVDKKTDEYSGDAYGFELVYSGNHSMALETDQLAQTRVLVGINDYNFSWKLEAGDEFQTPEVLLTYSGEGLNKMSQNFHEVIRERVVRSKFKHQKRPILVNNWEATYFDFDEKKLKPIVDEAKNLGIEMFVLDDGWFGHRNDDNSSLGDWKIFEKKFPKGLGHFADYVHDKGLKFGLWFEPEMISYDSDLYREHPDYLMQVPGRAPSPSRNQYILDLTRPEVVDVMYKQVADILANNGIDYVKWDMNRSLSDIYSVSLPADRQGEVYHRYVLGYYDLMGRLVDQFPDILFEGCSGGGGRFDAGVAYYMPQIWASDNTDAVARLAIQYGTSLAYPPSMMTAHVSAVPNHQTGRKTPFETRGAAAMSAVFGYELDLTKLTDEEKAMVKNQIADYNKVRDLVVNGDFYRLKSPTESNQAAWNFVSKDKKEVFVATFAVLAFAQPYLTKTKLKGLDPEKKYKNEETGEVFYGDELMELGIYDPVVHQDYMAKTYLFKAIN